MAVTETRIVKYEIENPSLKGVEFTEPSREYLVWPKAVEFAAGQGKDSILASVFERGAFRVEAEGKHDADLYQATRTVALYFKVGGKFYAAIDDTVDPEQNIVISRAQPGFKSHSQNGKYLLPISDALVKGALLRAEKSGRIVEANAESPLELKTKQVDGRSDFGQNDWNKAILLDVAEPYAQMLSQRGYDIGRVWSLTSGTLENIGVDGSFVEVRPVGLGYNFNVIDYVYANDLFDDNGRACGVRRAREFSIGNKGKLVKLNKKVFAFVRKQCA